MAKGVEVLKEKGGLGEILEQPSIPGGIRCEVKKRILKPKVPKKEVSEEEIEEESLGKGTRPHPLTLSA